VVRATKKLFCRSMKAVLFDPGECLPMPVRPLRGDQAAEN
jgi:hypothetical protein